MRRKVVREGDATRSKDGAKIKFQREKKISEYPVYENAKEISTTENKHGNKLKTLEAFPRKT